MHRRGVSQSATHHRGKPKTYLIFEIGEVNNAFYLFSVGV